MNVIARNVWAFFIATMLFGGWVFPIFAAIVIVYAIIYKRWPGFFEKYL